MIELSKKEYRQALIYLTGQTSLALSPRRAVEIAQEVLREIMIQEYPDGLVSLKKEMKETKAGALKSMIKKAKKSAPPGEFVDETTDAEIARHVRECLEVKDSFTDLERSFLENMNRLTVYSDKQITVVERLHAKACSLDEPAKLRMGTPTVEELLGF